MAEEHNLVGTEMNNRYRVMETIGHGAYSPIFLVKETLTSQLFAMKILDKYLGEDENFMLALNNVTAIQSELDEQAYTHIVRTIESGRIQNTETNADGAPFIIMELMDGSMQDQELTLEQKIFCIAESTKGLEAAHKNDLLHLNYHAGNVMITMNNGEIEEVKVGDFGVGAMMDDTGKYTTRSNRPIKYPAFEQTTAGKDMRYKITEKTDVYQVGATILELTTGLLPEFKDVLDELEKFNDVPKRLSNLITDCLELYPEDKPDLRDVRYRLGRLLTEGK